MLIGVSERLNFQAPLRKRKLPLKEPRARANRPVRRFGILVSGFQYFHHGNKLAQTIGSDDPGRRSPEFGCGTKRRCALADAKALQYQISDANTVRSLGRFYRLDKSLQFHCE